MSRNRKGPELQMQDVLLACGELSKRERAAVSWTLRRHNEIVAHIIAEFGQHPIDCAIPPAPCSCGLSLLMEKYADDLEAYWEKNDQPQ